MFSLWQQYSCSVSLLEEFLHIISTILGNLMSAFDIKKSRLKRAGILMLRKVKLLQRLRGSNSQVNGHTDHGHELARRQWRSQGQAQCVQRSASEEGALSPTRMPGTANGQIISNLRIQVALYNPNGR